MAVPDADRQVGFRIQTAREAGEWNQSQLSASLIEAGLPWSQGTLSRVETGQRPVRLTEAVILAEVLGVPLTELIPGHSSLDAALRRVSDKEHNALSSLGWGASELRTARNLAQLLRIAHTLRQDPEARFVVDRSAARALWDATTWRALEDVDVYDLLNFFGLGKDSIEAMRADARTFMDDHRGDTLAAAAALEKVCPADFLVHLVGPGNDDGSPGEGELRLRHLLVHAGQELEGRFSGLSFTVSTVAPEELIKVPIEVDGLSRLELPHELSALEGVVRDA